MAEYTDRFQITRVASGNLDGSQFTFVRGIGQDVLTIAASGQAALGVLQNKPRDNEHASVCVLGSTKIYLATSLGSNIFLMTGNSGAGVQAASGQVSTGFLITGATSGGIGEMIFNVHPSSL